MGGGVGERFGHRYYEGKIWAENQAGGGAVFRFTLPLVQAPRSDGVPEQTLHLQAAGELKV